MRDRLQDRPRSPAAAISQQQRCRGNSAKEVPRRRSHNISDVAATPSKRPRGCDLTTAAMSRQLRPRDPAAVIAQQQRCRGNSAQEALRQRSRNSSDVAATPPKRPRGGDRTTAAMSRQLRPKGPATAISLQQRCRGNSAQEAPRWLSHNNSDVAATPPKRPHGCDLTTAAMSRQLRPRGAAAAITQQQRCRGNSAQEAPRLRSHYSNDVAATPPKRPRGGDRTTAQEPMAADHTGRSPHNPATHTAGGTNSLGVSASRLHMMRPVTCEGRGLGNSWGTPGKLIRRPD